MGELERQESVRVAVIDAERAAIEGPDSVLRAVRVNELPGRLVAFGRIEGRAVGVLRSWWSLLGLGGGLRGRLGRRWGIVLLLLLRRVRRRRGIVLLLARRRLGGRGSKELLLLLVGGAGRLLRRRGVLGCFSSAGASSSEGIDVLSW